MTAQTKGVDALAVMNFASEGLEEAGLKARAHKLDAARDAIAELIEAAESAEKLIRNCVNARQIGSGYMGHADDLRAALARIGGAK
jgi:hypothetical protein